MKRNLPVVLVCIDWFEPGFLAGGPIRSIVNFCFALHQHLQIYVLTSDHDAGSKTPYPDVQTNTWLNYHHNIQVMYLDKSGLNYRHVKKIIMQISPGFIYLNSMYSVGFTIYPLLVCKFNHIVSKIILAPRGMLHDGALQYKSFKKYTFLRGGRATGLFTPVTFQATDEKERFDIKKHVLVPDTHIVQLANFPKGNQSDYSVVKKEPGYLSLVFVSRIAAKKNLLGVLQILESLGSDSHVDFTIYGVPEDTSYFETCQNIIPRLPATVKVHFKGAVEPDKVDFVIKSNHLFILPTFGENFGHAIFEALLAGRPVLISDQTPWQNLNVHRAGWVLPIADKDKWTNTLRELAAMDQEAYNKWSEGAWNYAARYLSDNDLKQQYLKLFS